jgi:hypothetical protein
MALVTRNTGLTVETITAAHANQIPASLGLIAGAAIDGGAPCRIAADGLVYMTDATAADALARVSGWAPKAYLAGQVVTLFGRGVIFEYGTGLTPGATLYAAATAGRLDDAATVGDAVGVAQVVNTTHIRVTRDN